jgi:hypothetical protein
MQKSIHIFIKSCIYTNTYYTCISDNCLCSSFPFSRVKKHIGVVHDGLYCIRNATGLRVFVPPPTYMKYIHMHIYVNTYTHIYVYIDELYCIRNVYCIYIFCSITKRHILIIYIYIYIYIYIHIYMNINIYIYIYIYIYICMYIYIYIYIYMYIYIYVYIHVYIHVYICIYICIYIYISIYISVRKRDTRQGIYNKNKIYHLSVDIDLISRFGF